MALPIGVYSLFFQPGNVEYYLTLDPNSQFQPTFSVLIPGAKSQQWKLSGDQASNLRAICSISAGVCIGRSAANLNDTLTEPTPVPWYIATSPFGPGWYKFSANANDAGPWWVVSVEPSSGTPETLILDSSGWNIFFLRPIQADPSITSLPLSSSSSSSSTAITGLSAIQNSTTSTSISTTSFTSPSPSTPLSTSVMPTSTAGISTATASNSGGNSNALSQGDIAGLASSIPLGILSLILGAWGLWFARKQQKAGKPVIQTLISDIRYVFHRHPSQSHPATDHDGYRYEDGRA